jgi:hypothetical protein
MTAPAVRIERRVGQRFPYLLPTSFRQISNGIEGVGFTQDLSSRGVFFLTDAPLTEGSEIELTVRMPSEITLGENMPVRCKGRILRIVSQQTTSGASSTTHPKIGVAVRLECYEYLPDRIESSVRVSTLHPRQEEESQDSQSLASRAG